MDGGEKITNYTARCQRHVCEQLAQGCYLKARGRIESNLQYLVRSTWSNSRLKTVKLDASATDRHAHRNSAPLAAAEQTLQQTRLRGLLWSTNTPIYQCLPPRGTARQTVNSRQPSLCDCGSTCLEYTLPTDVVAASSLSTFRRLLKRFFIPAIIR